MARSPGARVAAAGQCSDQYCEGSARGRRDAGGGSEVAPSVPRDWSGGAHAGAGVVAAGRGGTATRSHGRSASSSSGMITAIPAPFTVWRGILEEMVLAITLAAKVCCGVPAGAAADTAAHNGVVAGDVSRLRRWLRRGLRLRRSDRGQLARRPAPRRGGGERAAVRLSYRCFKRACAAQRRPPEQASGPPCALSTKLLMHGAL
mgnify:CR=1 FL=1